MNQAEVVARIKTNPKFAYLLKRRNGFAWKMTGLMVLVYFAYLLLIAFNRPLMAQPISADIVIPLSVPLGLGVIAFAIAITWIYVRRANAEFDDLKREVIKEGLKR